MGKPHEQLDAWKFSMELTKAVYQMTATFPAEERYGLSQQMRRAAVSIPSNIAEGAGRNGAKEFLNFIGISRGSLAELETSCNWRSCLDSPHQTTPPLNWRIAPDIYQLVCTRN